MSNITPPPPPPNPNLSRVNYTLESTEYAIDVIMERGSSKNI